MDALKMEHGKETITSRLRKLNGLLLKKSTTIDNNLLTRETLFDALQVLYDECNTDFLRNSDRNIGHFVEKFRKVLLDLKLLRINLTDFEVKSIIGRGYFADVHVVKEKHTGDIYAMKTIRKYESSDVKCNFYEEERNIMALCRSEWLTQLQYAFQDNSCLYFIMEYHPGGDLLGLLERQGGSIPENAASFYIAEIAVAVNDLHSMGYTHRDLKPDNVLLDRCGHIKLADFGSAGRLTPSGTVVGVAGRPNNGRTDIPVGTPDYIAPEVLQSYDIKPTSSGHRTNTYGKSCDFWSLGIIAYELCVGNTPFAGTNTTKTYSNIMDYRRTLKFPSDILLTQAYQYLIRSLITDPNSRFGYEELMKYELYNDINFDTLREQVPPFVPKVNSADDTSNFSSDIQKSKKREPNVENFKSKCQFSGRNLPFVGFSYVTELQDPRDFYSINGSRLNDANTPEDNSDKLKKQIDSLQKSLAKKDDILLNKDNLEKKLLDAMNKLESAENIRDRLELNLANSISEAQALKRTLEIERKDRADLEEKALELIKSAKLKWEAYEKIKLEALRQELTESNTKIECMLKEIDSLNEQLQKASRLSTKQKVSLENFEELKRHSIIGLENRLETITVETQTKLSALKTQFDNEQRKRVELEKIVGNLTQDKLLLEKQLYEARDSNIKLIDSEKRITVLTKDIDALKQNLEKMTTTKMDLDKEWREKYNELQTHVQENAKKEGDANIVLRKQIKDLKSELSSILTTKLSVSSEHEKIVANLKSNVESLTSEKTGLEAEVGVVRLQLTDKTLAMDTLRSKIKSLETDNRILKAAKSDTDSSKDNVVQLKESILQEQVERLEKEIVQVHETMAVDKQEYDKLKTQFWRIEKDLANAQLDKKIVERDLKERIEKFNEVQKEISTLTSENYKMNTKIDELESYNRKVTKDLEAITESKLHLEEKLKGDKTVFEEVTKRLEESCKSSELKVCTVLKKLDEAKIEKIVLFKQMQETNENILGLETTLKDVQNKNALLKSDLYKIQEKLENNYKNRQALREACSLLENQLIEFETILDCSEVKRESLEQEIGVLNAKLDVNRIELDAIKRQAADEKSLRLIGETKISRLETEKIEIQVELNTLKEKYSDLKSYSSSLSEDIMKGDQVLNDFKVKVNSFERLIENYASENNLLKEDSSKHITIIGELRDTNYTLGKNIRDYKEHENLLMVKIRRLQDILNENLAYYKERELKSLATNQQQIKLIHYLQSKIEENGKKKKTISDMLFGHSKKENIPPFPNTSQSGTLTLDRASSSHRDLEAQLQKERELNRQLRLEVESLKAHMSLSINSESDNTSFR